MGYNTIRRCLRFKSVSLGLLVVGLALVPQVAFASNEDRGNVQLLINRTAEFRNEGNDIFKSNTVVTVITDKPYGFSLTVHAKGESDLVNTNDPSLKIASLPAASPVKLGANQWGYALSTDANVYNGIPAASNTAAVIADVTADHPDGCTNLKFCNRNITYAANIDHNNITPGEYTTTVVYTATAKPAPPVLPPLASESICRSGDEHSECQVDIDSNMVPVTYTGDTNHAEWTSLADPEDATHQGEWYNYNRRQWANAVTVKDPSKYIGKQRVVEQDDILGFWVYIPRYAYEVQRRNATDKPVAPQNFKIHFEKGNVPFRVPKKCDETGKDYRTECGIPRNFERIDPNSDLGKEEVIESGTWGTPQAFYYQGGRLNGFWVAKFELTGSVDQPTVLPNERTLAGAYKDELTEEGNQANSIGYYPRAYTIAQRIGVTSPLNPKGFDDFKPPKENAHNLARYHSQMLNNAEWGAIAYLTASPYGAGYNGVQSNNHYITYKTEPDAEGKSDFESYGVSGCGPWLDGDTKNYGDNAMYNDHVDKTNGAFDTQEACSTSNPQRAYNGTIGQLASTTHSVFGVYDMVGGNWEYTAATLSKSKVGDNSNDNALPPVVRTAADQLKHDLLGLRSHKSKVFRIKLPSDNKGGTTDTLDFPDMKDEKPNTTFYMSTPFFDIYDTNDINKNCDYINCGAGSALYETNNGKGNGYNAWNGEHFSFVTYDQNFLMRGGDAYSYGKMGLFSADSFKMIGGGPVTDDKIKYVGNNATLRVALGVFTFDPNAK